MSHSQSLEARLPLQQARQVGGTVVGPPVDSEGRQGAAVELLHSFADQAEPQSGHGFVPIRKAGSNDGLRRVGKGVEGGHGPGRRGRRGIGSLRRRGRHDGEKGMVFVKGGGLFVCAGGEGKVGVGWVGRGACVGPR